MNKNHHSSNAVRPSLQPTAGCMAPKRPESKQQQQLNVDQYTLLKKPMEHLGRQLNVPGSFWQGRMSEDERDKIYKCKMSTNCKLRRSIDPAVEKFKRENRSNKEAIVEDNESDHWGSKVGRAVSAADLGLTTQE